MKHLLIALLLFMSSSCVEAATRFWVGGTGTADLSSTTHWAATSGGAGGQTVPISTDTVTFDASSGGGTVTINANFSWISITMGAFTGTLDFATNNNSVTLQTFSGTGSGVRTLNMGSGVWTVTGTGSVTVWDITTATNFTFNANSSTLVFSGGSAGTVRSFSNGATLTYSTVTINGLGSFQFTSGLNLNIATLNIGAPNAIYFRNAGTITLTNAPNWAGTANSLILLSNIGILTGATSAISLASGTPIISWAAIQNMNFSGGATWVANSAFSLGGANTGIAINSPSVGGGCILGGWLLWRDLPEHINDNFPAWLEKVT